MKVKNQSQVTQSCPTLSDSMDCSPPGSSIHGIFQARVLEWGAIAFSKSHTLVVLKILQDRLQQYMNCELPDVQAGFRKAEKLEIKLPKSVGSLKKPEFQKNIYFCFIDYAKTFDCVDHNKLQEILKEMGIPEHLTCLLKNLYAGQEATVRTGHGTTDWFQIGKGVHQSCILSPCLFNLYGEYIM